jgi:hypothetical protein
VTVILTSLLFTYGSASGQTTNNNLITYNNPNFGIKIQYPADWSKEERDNEFSKDVMFLAPGSPLKYAEKFSIGISDAEAGKSLTDIVTDLIDFNKHKNDALTNYQVIESTSIIVNNIPWKCQDYGYFSHKGKQAL